MDEISERMKKFIESNPYPSYTEMEELQSRKIVLDSEYGLYNHHLCRNIYENLYHEKCNEYVDNWIRVVTTGSGGGIFTLKCNVETLRLFTPISKCDIPELLEKFKEIYYFIKKIS